MISDVEQLLRHSSGLKISSILTKNEKFSIVQVFHSPTATPCVDRLQCHEMYSSVKFHILQEFLYNHMRTSLLLSKISTKTFQRLKKIPIKNYHLAQFFGDSFDFKSTC